MRATVLWSSLVVIVTVLAGCGGGGNDTIDNRKASAKNMQAVGFAAITWAADHSDQLPGNVAVVVIEGNVTPDKLLSPRVGTTTPATISSADLEAAKKKLEEADSPGKMEAAWKPIAAQLEGHMDYAYAFKGVKNLIDPSIVIAWEKPAELKDGVNVLFLDNHVALVPLADLPRVIEESNAARKKGSLPVIEVQDGVPVGQ